MRLFFVFTCLFAFASFVAGDASAHGPTPKRLTKEVHLSVSADKVWALIAKPECMAEWHPQIVTSKLDGPAKRGTLRTLEFSNGSSLVEGIDGINNEAKRFSYRLKKEDWNALPVSFYSAKMIVSPEENGALVTWVANFYRADTSNYPSEAHNDEAAIDAMDKFMESGLAGLATFMTGNATH